MIPPFAIRMGPVLRNEIDRIAVSKDRPPMNSNVESTNPAVLHPHRTFATSKRRFLVLLLGIAACFHASAQAPVDRMDQIARSYSDDHQFMGSILVAQGDKVVFEKSYGSANLEWNIPDDSLTKFRIGSMTKQFTAASILLLEERGKLSADDYVKKYMPDAPAAWDKITIYNLLTHTSGIPSFTSFPDYHASEGTPTTPKALVDRFLNKPLEFQPGEKWNYSNSGYVLLGYLLEKISGQTYADFVTQNIFKPLGMNDSGYDSNAAVILHRASGYTPSPDGLVNSGYIDMTTPFSAGALYSTTHDLLLWEQALYGGKVLSAASLKKMTTPYKENYGCGLMITTAKGHLQYEHGGGIEGFNTDMSYYPDDKLTVIVLANLNGGAPGDIAGKLAAVVHGEKVVLQSDRKEIKVPREVLARYVGSYELVPGIFITMSLDGDKFFTQLSGQPKFEVFAETEKDFFLKVVDAQLTFEMDAQGKVTDVVLRQNGRDQTAKRNDNAPPPKEHKEIAIDPKILDNYVGAYELAPNFILTVTREGDHLFTQATGQGKIEVFPETDHDFFLKVIDAQITFVTDSQGKATSLILHQGGDHPARRLQ
jgi:CubicO group peptidase (beta-lactamase class C family)